MLGGNGAPGGVARHIVAAVLFAAVVGVHPQLAQGVQAGHGDAGTEQQRLRATIAQLNTAAARAADVPTAAATEPAPSADAATTARELLGQCSGQYAAVAAAADALSAQVLGLQDWARMVQGVAFEQGQRNDF